MRMHRPGVALLLLLVLAVLAAGCQKKPDPTRLSATVSAAENVNPDASGRPSPIVVRYYELKSRKTFDAADFFDLYEKGETVLAAEMLNWGEVEVLPGESKQLELELNPDTRYVGFIAAFQDLDQAQWRAAIQPMPTKVKSAKVTLDGVTMTVE